MPYRRSLENATLFRNHLPRWGEFHARAQDQACSGPAERWTACGQQPGVSRTACAEPCVRTGSGVLLLLPRQSQPHPGREQRQTQQHRVAADVEEHGRGLWAGFHGRGRKTAAVHVDAARRAGSHPAFWAKAPPSPAGRNRPTADLQTQKRPDRFQSGRQVSVWRKATLRRSWRPWRRPSRRRRRP